MDAEAGKSIEPGMPGNPIRLTDPKMMRALAHPGADRDLAHLGLRGPATATECAEVAGLSPSACSYHLRTLAKYGFVEEDRASAADGRERPWRARLLAFTLEDSPDAAGRPGGQPVAGGEPARFGRGGPRPVPGSPVRVSGRVATARRARRFSAAHVTPDELDEMRAKVLGSWTPYLRLDPAERSPGALPVRVMLDLFPWFGRRRKTQEES